MSRLGADVVLHATGDGFPIVLLHCLGVDHRLWDDVVVDLGRDHRLLTYDLPGHGRTPTPPRRYDIDELADQLASILDAAAITQVHLVGMSLGGCVAQAFAARHPGRLRRLVLADTTPQYPQALKDKWVERATIARQQGVQPLIEEKLLIWFTPAFVAAADRRVRYVRETLAACDGEGYALACEALGDADLREQAGRIRAPTLIVLGEGDLPPFHDAARWLRDTIPGSRIALLAEARHAAPLQQPAAFAALLREFFAEDPAAAGAVALSLGGDP